MSFPAAPLSGLPRHSIDYVRWLFRVQERTDWLGRAVRFVAAGIPQRNEIYLGRAGERLLVDCYFPDQDDAHDNEYIVVDLDTGEESSEFGVSWAVGRILPDAVREPATPYEVVSHIGSVPLRRVIDGIGDAMRWAREDERRGRRATVSHAGVVVYESPEAA